MFTDRLRNGDESPMRFAASALPTHAFG
jgi:hypothetical protein